MTAEKGCAPGSDSRGTNGRAATTSTTSHLTIPDDALMVLVTSVGQLDALAGLAADALVHGDPLPLDVMVGAVDRIATRQRAALARLVAA